MDGNIRDVGFWARNLRREIFRCAEVGPRRGQMPHRFLEYQNPPPQLWISNHTASEYLSSCAMDDLTKSEIPSGFRIEIDLGGEV